MILPNHHKLALGSQPNDNLRHAVDAFENAATYISGQLPQKSLGLAACYADDGAIETAIDMANAVYALLKNRRPANFMATDEDEQAIDLIVSGLASLKDERERRYSLLSIFGMAPAQEWNPKPRKSFTGGRS